MIWTQSLKVIKNQKKILNLKTPNKEQKQKKKLKN